MLNEKLTPAERAALLIGSAGLFVISMTVVFGMIVLAYQKKSIPPSLGVVIGMALPGGINALSKIGEDSKLKGKKKP